GTGFTSGGYSMGTAAWSQVRNAIGNHGAIIIAGNASASNLYLKTTSNSRPFGAQMPFGESPLSSAQQIAIRDWINQGALNN
ncbi:MAG: hypothetical protein V3T75_01465, partial [candidate division Zixibacteria bacterium]